MNRQHSWSSLIQETVILTAAVAIIAAAVYFFLLPSHASVSSISGLGIVLSNFIPLPLSAITMILNVVLLIIGFFTCGREFGAKTVYTSLLMPVFLYVFELIFPNNKSLTNDVVLDTICYILVVSVGLALLFNANASSGGLDIVAKLLNKYLHIEIGKAMTLAGMCTAISSIFVYDTKTLVLSILGTYANGIVLDHFIDGFNRRKRICILTEQYKELQNFIVHELHRGVTLYPAIGGYNNEEKIELVTILTRNEYAEVLNYLHSVDENAFVTVSTVNEVIGQWNVKQKMRGI